MSIRNWIQVCAVGKDSKDGKVMVSARGVANHSLSQSLTQSTREEEEEECIGRGSVGIANGEGRGGWKAAAFIIGVEIAERMAYYGITSNLITYLTDVMHESPASAAKNVNNWTGFTFIAPFIGAVVADAHLGRYRTIVFASIAYVLGLVILTSSVSLRCLKPPPCTSNWCKKLTPAQVGIFFFSLYLISIGTGGHKTCLEAFGADQFSHDDPEERKQKSSFFNWWYFGVCSGVLVSVTVLPYIQENIGWGVGFGIPSVTMALAVCIFLYGSRFYRHRLPDATAITYIIQMCATSSGNWNARRPTPLNEPDNEGPNVDQRGSHMMFVDQAGIKADVDKGNIKIQPNNRRHCVVNEIDDAKIFVRVVPIWVASFMFGIVVAQTTTFFTKQGSTMKRRITPSFEIPAAAVHCFIDIAILVVLPLYDCILIPMMRRMTGEEHGITLFQRIGAGLFLSILCMVSAALSEMMRLKAARDYDLVDKPHATIPISVFWLLPQYVLYGIADALIVVGLHEYFYTYMPNTMRSMGIALSLSVFGVGNFLSSILISFVEAFSSKAKGPSWFDDNLNKSHLDYFYWLLAVLSALNFTVYVLYCYCHHKLDGTTSSADEEA